MPASAGAYTVATAMFILGALDIERTQMGHGALLALSGGLIFAAPACRARGAELFEGAQR